jgi:hypothetical protein
VVTEIGKEIEVATEISSATSAEGSDIWPETAKIPETGLEVTIAKTEEIGTEVEITTETRVPDATIARSTVTWQETAREVHND